MHGAKEYKNEFKAHNSIFIIYSLPAPIML